MRKIITLTLAILSASFQSNMCAQNSSEIKTMILIKKIIDFDYEKSANYKIVSIKDFSLKRLSRKDVRIVVPKNLSRETLINTVKKAVYQNFMKLDKPHALSVLVYKEGDNTNSTYTVAMCDFAPYGDWGYPEKTSYKNYELKLNVND
jgi:hypothetical protein